MKKLITLLLLFSTLFYACSSDTKENNTLDKPSTSSSNGAFSSQEQTVGSKTVNTNQDIDLSQQMNIKLTPFVPAYEGIGESGSRLLKDRLNAAITKITVKGSTKSSAEVIPNACAKSATNGWLNNRSGAIRMARNGITAPRLINSAKTLININPKSNIN